MRTDSVLLALQRATHATLGLLASELVDLDLTASEINALANLADGSATPTVLATAIGIRPTTLTSVLDRLERRGHVTRGNRADDRRSVLVTLTADGQVAAATIRAAMQAMETRMLAGLSDVQIRGLRDGLAALAQGERP